MSSWSTTVSRDHADDPSHLTKTSNSQPGGLFFFMDATGFRLSHSRECLRNPFEDSLRATSCCQRRQPCADKMPHRTWIGIRAHGAVELVCVVWGPRMPTLASFPCLQLVQIINVNAAKLRMVVQLSLVRHGKATRFRSESYAWHSNIKIVRAIDFHTHSLQDPKAIRI